MLHAAGAAKTAFHRRAMERGVLFERYWISPPQPPIHQINVAGLDRWRPISQDATAPQSPKDVLSSPELRSTHQAQPPIHLLSQPHPSPPDDAQKKFVMDFVAAWDKVMNLDRFDVK